MLRLVNVVEYPKSISGSEAKFPCRLKEHRPFQGFSIACDDIRFIGQPCFNSPSNERIIFGLDGPQMAMDDRSVDKRERLLWLHGD